MQRSHVLLCLFDTLSTDLINLGAAPALARLATQSIVFSDVYAPNPERGPARASILTGLDTAVHGVWADGVALPQHIVTVPEIFSRAGYTTWLAGRWQLAGLSRWTTESLRPGTFSAADWAHGPLHRSRQNSYLNWLQSTYPQQHAALFDRQADPDNTRATAQQRQTLYTLPTEMSFNHWIGQCLSTRIREHQNQQAFFAIAGFSTDPALGASPQTPVGDTEDSMRALQDADAAIGTLIDTLRDTGHLDNTLIVVASASGMPSQGGRYDLKEPAIKTSLLIHGSGKPPHTETRPASTIDLAPTLLDAVGVNTQLRMQGRSLLDDAQPMRDWILSRLRTGTRTDTGCWQTALRKGARKLIFTHSKTQGVTDQGHQLFNLEQDPDERVNLAGDAEYRKDLDAMIDSLIDARCALEDRTEARIASF